VAVQNKFPVQRDRPITLRELKRRCGISFVDGRKVSLGYDWQRRTVQRGDETSSGPIHREQQRSGQFYFRRAGFKLFPFQVGVKNVMAMADFAAARFRKVILVECLTDLQSESQWVSLMQAILHPPPTVVDLLAQKIKNKLQMAQCAELWFIVETDGKQILTDLGYVCRRLPHRAANVEPFKTQFWLCRPSGSPSAKRRKNGRPITAKIDPEQKNR
jgi:hypothetical protein